MLEQDLFQSLDGGSIPTSPLQMKVLKIPAFEACELNKRWHSRLPIIDWSNVVRNTHYICFAITNGKECFGVGIWSSPVAQNRFKDGKRILELRRMALSSRCPKNTASRFLRIMISI